jgi:hypothetical protein
LVTERLRQLLAGGAALQLPAASNAGMLSFPPVLPGVPPLVGNFENSCLSLPVLRPSGEDPNSLFVPVNQPIYRLADYLPNVSGSDPDDTLNVVDGHIRVGQSKRKIGSAHEWACAFRNFAVLLAASPAELPIFSWTDISLYQNMIAGYFLVYTFTSVVEYDLAFRKWRRAFGRRWSDANHYLVAVHLKPKPVTSTPHTSAPPRTSSGPGPVPGRRNRCYEFSGSNGCKRPACNYAHTCAQCKTTWPSSQSKCVCVNGAFRNGYSPPNGVVLGQ